MSSAAANSHATVKQTIVTNLEAPRLNGVSTKHFTKFLMERELYEKQVSEKNKEPGVDITPASYRASIIDEDLEIFVTARWVSSETVSSVTEEELRKCIRDRAVRETNADQLWKIDQVVKKVAMNTSLPEAEDRIWTLHRQYLTVLRSAGYTDLTEKKPHIAVGHILKRVKPYELRQRMRDIIKWRKDDQFGKRDFGDFMRELAKQAKRLEDEQGFVGQIPAETAADSDSSQDDGVWKRTMKAKNCTKKLKHARPTKQSTEGIQKPADVNKNKRKRDTDLPPCLNTEKCKGHHFISECPNSTEEEKVRLRKEYRESKRRRGNEKEKGIHGTVRRLGAEAIDSHSSLFSATFANGAVESVVLADQGADANMIPPAVFQLIKASGAVIPITHLKPAHRFATVDENTKITCDKKISADVHLRIRHGTKLIIRNVEWYISDCHTEQVILGRPLLEAIGCNNRVLLSAACDQNDGVINAPDQLKKYAAEVPTKGSIAAIMSSGVYHSAGGDENDGLQEDDVYIDLGEDEESELTKALGERLQEASENGISPNGLTKLRNIVFKHKQIFD